MPASLDARISQIDRIADPTTRALAAHQLVADIEAAQAQAVYKRDAAVLEAHEQGSSFSVLAKRLGVSRTRIQQFINRARGSEGPAALRTKAPNEARPPKRSVAVAV